MVKTLQGHELPPAEPVKENRNFVWRSGHDLMVFDSEERRVERWKVMTKNEDYDFRLVETWKMTNAR